MNKIISVIGEILFLSFLIVNIGAAQNLIDSLPNVNSLPILTKEALMNAEYLLDYSINEKPCPIKLHNGYFEYPEECIGLENDGSWYVQYGQEISCELNGDSLIDAVVVLYEKLGGTGYFPYLIPVLNIGGVPKTYEPFYLVDKTDIIELYKRKSFLYVKLLVPNINDGACCPSKEATWKLKFQKDHFIKIN